MSILELYASKLGIHSRMTFRKANEYMKKLEIRGGMSKLNMTLSCVQVICLDLAATLDSITIDRNASIKLSGLNKRAYKSSYKAVESLLDLTQVHSIKDLTVQFSCTPAQSLAEEVLRRYEEDHRRESDGGVDFGATLFKCAAISAACKKSKVKVDHTKLFEIAAVRRSAFESLTSLMEKIAQDILGATREKSQQRHQTLMDRVYANMQENDSSVANTSVNRSSTEDFDEWKRKILEQAG